MPEKEPTTKAEQIETAASWCLTVLDFMVDFQGGEGLVAGGLRKNILASQAEASMSDFRCYKADLTEVADCLPEDELLRLDRVLKDKFGAQSGLRP